MMTGLQVAALTFALVHEETAGSSEVDGVIDPEALQILTHLPSLREFRINVFEINLRRERGTRLEKKSEPFLMNKATFLQSLPSPPDPQSLCRHRWTPACMDAPPASRQLLRTNKCVVLQRKTGF